MSQCAFETVKELFQAAIGNEDVVPGMVVGIHTWGNFANHRGEVKIQKELQEKYDDYFLRFRHLLKGTAASRDNLRFEFVVRSWNQQFNSYQFDLETIDKVVWPIVRDYEQSARTGEKDDLLGQMWGVHGAISFVQIQDRARMGILCN